MVHNVHHQKTNTVSKFMPSLFAMTLWEEIFMSPILTTLATLVLMGVPSDSECKLQDLTQIGKTNQGGYQIQYQSGVGNGCRIYRVRNSPGGVLSPVKWEDDNEIFLNVDLSACNQANNSCTWVESIKLSEDKIHRMNSQLSYGVNKDEFKEKITAYRSKPPETEVAERPRPLITILRGTVMRQNNEPLSFNIGVKSEIGDIKGNGVKYTFEVLGKDFNQYQIQVSGTENKEKNGLGILWEIPADKSLNQKLNIEPVKVSRETKYSVNSDFNRYKIQRSLLLSIVEGEKKLVSTSAPAYVELKN